MKLVKFYEELLASLNVTFGDEGELLWGASEKSEGTHIGINYVHEVNGNVSGKLYLPTTNVLSKPEDPKIVKFHPTSENCWRGRSEVFNKLVELVVTRLRLAALDAASAINELAQLPDHSRFPTSTLDLILDVELPINARDLVYWNRVVEKIATDKNKGVLGLKIARGAKIEETTYSRVVTLNPHVLKSLEDEQPYGIKPPNARSVNNLRAVFNAVFDTAEIIRSGSNSKSHPYLEALLNTYVKVAEHFNSIFKKVGKFVDTTEYFIDTDWASAIPKLEKMHIRDLDMRFPGNIGLGGNREEETEREEAQPRREQPNRARSVYSSVMKNEPVEAPSVQKQTVRPAPEEKPYNPMLDYTNQPQQSQQPMYEQQSPQSSGGSMEDRLLQATAPAPAGMPGAFNPMMAQQQGNPYYPQQMPTQPMYGQQMPQQMPAQQPMQYPNNQYQPQSNNGYYQPQPQMQQYVPGGPTPSHMMQQPTMQQTMPASRFAVPYNR